MYKLLIRPILFLFDPEKVHHFTFSFLKSSFKIPFVKGIVKSMYTVNHVSLERELFGLKFKNPVGLGAGFDKNAVLINELENFGFGFIEIGTVTPRAQEGNPKKRLFRLKADKGIINRMGFNNAGVEEISKRLKELKTNVIIGGNIGKMTSSSSDQYTQDYLECFNELHPNVDYFVLNVSCPNVGSMAKLQDKDYLVELITAVQNANSKFELQRPILLKIAPDLNDVQLQEIIDLVAETRIDGVIASNTSTNREGLKVSNERLEEIGNGGLSGQPVKDRSTKTIKFLADKSNKAFPIIGIGGIHSSKDALEKIEAGADLVQVYTGFIYEGPGLVKKINKALIR
ncbi:quinone-dependent dihydroorotate dehydrogenase [Urechidicola vernalis]|uniref:Dihydroorotate dehydrogenase (quinone) n=1 Tax=Urechidicola vernalis TaxID=3075600 RepID=A0ABU2Y171_9FLAO|nr:quinone-dependent dihydroorotate dehydrogenase [Urechidicola sp. P050]MDT0551881.1 quinone-dependent dihydroorotate dehydrogenase [Urechidicola sp. P050]